MARIRTIKPEFFESDTLAMVSLSAERTFAGLWPQADDYGRFRDNPSLLHGRIWAVRGDQHAPEDVADDLRQLAAVGVICRYVGCDGKPYLHVTNWAEHQKIDKPGAPHWPACPAHQPTQRCSRCKGSCAQPRTLAEGSPSPRPPFAHPSPTPRATASSPRLDLAPPPLALPEHSVHPDPDPRPPGVEDGETAAHGPFGEGSPNPPRGFPEPSPSPPGVLAEPSAPGPRTWDLGPPSGGRTAPAPHTGTVAADEPPAHPGSTTGNPPSTGRLLGEYVSACEQRPPERVLAHLGREIRTLLDEGHDPEHLRTALARLRAKALNPSVLPSLVNEILNPPRDQGGYRPWTNPTDESVYLGDM